MKVKCEGELRASHFALNWPRSTMDSIRASEAPDTGSIPVEATFSFLLYF